MCVCGSPHHYYPAAWLVPLVRNQWVPLERRRSDRARATSLANLVRHSGWPTDLLRTSPQVVALLKALRVGVPELIMELLTTDNEEREALNETLAQLLTSVGSDWDRLQVLAADIQEDGELFATSQNGGSAVSWYARIKDWVRSSRSWSGRVWRARASRSTVLVSARTSPYSLARLRKTNKSGSN